MLAPGAVNSYFGHDDWAHVAPGLKDLDDAVEIRRRVLLAFEAAEREPDLGRATSAPDVRGDRRRADRRRAGGRHRRARDVRAGA